MRQNPYYANRGLTFVWTSVHLPLSFVPYLPLSYQQAVLERDQQVVHERDLLNSMLRRSRSEHAIPGHRHSALDLVQLICDELVLQRQEGWYYAAHLPVRMNVKQCAQAARTAYHCTLEQRDTPLVMLDAFFFLTRDELQVRYFAVLRATREGLDAPSFVMRLHCTVRGVNVRWVSLPSNADISAVMPNNAHISAVMRDMGDDPADFI